MSRFLKRLQRQLKDAKTSERRAEYSARIACYLTRLGKVEHAKHYISTVRKTFSDGRSGRVTVWLMLAEGLIHYFEDRCPQAIDRLRAALALACAMGYSEFIATAAAWKAHFEFDEARFEDLIETLTMGLGHVASENIEARARFAIVYSNVFYACGDRINGQRWFLKAHALAVENGDQAGIEAVQYNKAALQTSYVRMEKCLGLHDAEEVRRLSMENFSTQNLNALVQTQSFPNQLRFLSIRQNMLAEEYGAAARQIEELRRNFPAGGSSFYASYVELELCYCNFKIGDKPAVEEYLASNPPQSFPNLDLDDQIVAFWMLWEMSSRDVRFGDAMTYRSSMEAASRKYARDLETLKMKLEQLLSISDR